MMEFIGIVACVVIIVGIVIGAIILIIEVIDHGSELNYIRTSLNRMDDRLIKLENKPVRKTK